MGILELAVNPSDASGSWLTSLVISPRAEGAIVILSGDEGDNCQDRSDRREADNPALRGNVAHVYSPNAVLAKGR